MRGSQRLVLCCRETAIDGITRFDCDRSRWWTRTDGSEITPRDAGSASCYDFDTKCDPRAFVGDSYNLRDIDCFDQSIAALRAEGVSTAALAGRGC